MQWLALSIHSNKIVGSIPSPGSFLCGYACSLCVCLDCLWVLWLPSTVQRHVGQANWVPVVGVSASVNGCLSIPCGPATKWSNLAWSCQALWKTDFPINHGYTALLVIDLDMKSVWCILKFESAVWLPLISLSIVSSSRTLTWTWTTKNNQGSPCELDIRHNSGDAFGEYQNRIKIRQVLKWEKFVTENLRKQTVFTCSWLHQHIRGWFYTSWCKWPYCDYSLFHPKRHRLDCCLEM